jgi:hypothetical protein
MTELTCGVGECVNNAKGKCCLPGIAVGGPNAGDAKQTFCSNFSEVQSASSAVCDRPMENLAIRCEAEHCSYNTGGRCDADHVDIRTTSESGWPEKTECATFRQESGTE